MHVAQYYIFCIANCGHPELLSTVSNDSVPRVEANEDLPVEGSTTTFSCLLGLVHVLIGSNSSTCMGNGEWEPDSSGLMCNDSKG